MEPNRPSLEQFVMPLELDADITFSLRNILLTTIFEQFPSNSIAIEEILCGLLSTARYIVNGAQPDEIELLNKFVADITARNFGEGSDNNNVTLTAN